MTFTDTEHPAYGNSTEEVSEVVADAKIGALLRSNASTVSVCSNARDKVELLSQPPRPHAERVLAAGELAIGGQIVPFECGPIATSLTCPRARPQRE